MVLRCQTGPVVGRQLHLLSSGACVQ
jgi:hypothetical protein